MDTAFPVDIDQVINAFVNICSSIEISPSTITCLVVRLVVTSTTPGISDKRVVMAVVQLLQDMSAVNNTSFMGFSWRMVGEGRSNKRRSNPRTHLTSNLAVGDDDDDVCWGSTDDEGLIFRSSL